MPVDYSKFDNIEDSDEEREKAAAIRQSPKPWEAPFQPPAREPPQSKPGSGRELLEPAGMDKRLKFVEGGDADGLSDADRLSQQLSRMMGSGIAPQLAGAPVETEEADNSKPAVPKKLCTRGDGRKKVHTTNPDGSELVEEFDERTDVLLLRKSRRPPALGGEGEWVFEVGQANEKAFDPHSDMMRASSSNPIFLRKDTPEHFQWRVRNLAYPADVYSVTIDQERQQIVVRTSNKKYFKRIDVEDLSRLGLKLKDESLSWKHQHNTLIISYARPLEVVKAEQQSLKLVAKTAMKI
jgi:hypothetical protein